MTLEVLAMLSSQSNLSKPQGMFRVLENANQLIGADWCEVSLLTPDRQSLVTQVAVGIGTWSSAPQPFVDLFRSTDLAESIKSQTIISRQIDTSKMTNGIKQFLEATHCRSAVGIPLIQRGQPQGIVVFADSRRGRVLKERDINVGGGGGGQVVTGLFNFFLLHDLDTSFTELEITKKRLVQIARLWAMGE